MSSAGMKCHHIKGRDNEPTCTRLNLSQTLNKCLPSGILKGHANHTRIGDREG